MTLTKRLLSICFLVGILVPWISSGINQPKLFSNGLDIVLQSMTGGSLLFNGVDVMLQISTLQSQYSTLMNETVSLRGLVTALQANASIANSNFLNLQAANAILNNQIVGIQSNVSGFQSSLLNTQSTVGSQGNSISVLQSTLMNTTNAMLSNQIVGIQSNVSVLQSSFQIISGVLAIQGNSISVVQSSLNATLPPVYCTNLPLGYPCFANECTMTGICVNGVCQAGPSKPDNTLCSTGYCQSGKCVANTTVVYSNCSNVGNGKSCSALPCILGACFSSICYSTWQIAPNFTACMNGSINAGICYSAVCKQPPSSCQQAYSAGYLTQSGTFNLTINGSVIPTYCYIYNGAFYSLLMKTDGNLQTFTYNSSLWTNQTGYNQTNYATGLDQTEYQSTLYWQYPFTQLLLGMKTNGSNSINWITMNYTATNLWAIISPSTFINVTTVSRAQWLSLVGSATSLQVNCNKAGFNVFPDGLPSTFNEIRIGILGNNENDCGTPDSRLGFGATGANLGGCLINSDSCGNECAVCAGTCSNGAGAGTTFGYILAL